MEKGTLYLVATPIGNLEDITIRALHTLESADLIAAEDTRVSGKLLSHYQISKKMISYYEHNKKSKEDVLLNYLEEGKNIALISDAGTPAISDPGADIAAAAIQRGINVVAIPGASAVLTGLAASGLDTTSFCFEGFLPREKKEKREKLEALASERRTMVFYEAPHRICKTLDDMSQAFGEDRYAVLGRELTKIHEEKIRGTFSQLIRHFAETEPRGEFVIMVSGCPEKPKQEFNPEMIGDELEKLLEQGISRKDAAKLLAKKYDCKAKQIYEIGLKD